MTRLRRPLAILALCGSVLIAVCAAPLCAAPLTLRGPTPQEQEFTPPLVLATDGAIEVSGTNESGKIGTLIVRVDDEQSRDYASRVNDERVIPVGPFRLSLPASALKTPSGRALQTGDIRRLIVFSADGSPFTISSVVLTGIPIPSAPPAKPPIAGQGPLILPLGGETPIEADFTNPIPVNPAHELIVVGENPTDKPRTLILRLDDRQSSSYATRFNQEKTIEPGPFQWRIPLKAVKTEAGRALDLGALERAYLFTPDNSGLLITVTAIVPPGGEVPKAGTAPTVGQPAPLASAPTASAPSTSPSPIPAAPQTGLAAGTGFTGKLPLSGSGKVDHSFTPPLKLDAAQEITITGENPSGVPALMVIRVDDGQSHDYATRLGDERVVPAGPFRLRLSVGQWKTPSGRPLDLGDIRRMILFAADDKQALRIASVTAERGFALPGLAMGWKFGPPGVAVMAGFEAIKPGDKRLSGPNQIALNRPGADPLIASGIKGIERFTVPLANGTWNVTLWTDDVGEWEYLPHELKRQIKINGQTVAGYQYRPEQWLHEVYFAGRNREAIADGDPWAVFGRRRGGLVAAEIKVTDGRLVIEQNGDSLEASYLAAVLVEPTGSHEALETVQQARRERFLERWPVAPYPPSPPYQGPLALAQYPALSPQNPGWRPSPQKPAPALVAQGGTGFVDFFALAAKDAKKTIVTVENPTLGGKTLPVELRWGQWTYTRRDPASAFLGLAPDYLRGDLGALRLVASLPRRFNLMIPVSKTAAPGLYTGAVTVTADGETVRTPFEIEVLPVTLPDPDRPIGIYMEDPPWFEWFAIKDADRDRATQCDLSYLSRLGLTGLSASLTTPVAGNARRYADQMALVRDAGFTQGVLAYSSIPRLVQAVGVDGLADPLAAVGHAIDLKGIEPPYWSIADEPGNPGSQPEDLRKLQGILHGAMPRAKIAGHLNHVRDRELLPLFDMVLLNNGFGIDAGELGQIKGKGIKPWLYNMPDMELAAGFFLWRSGADGYLQWHGRNPVADPFDPTIGREASVMLMPVSEEPCLAVPDLDAELLRMVRGIDDFRWLRWLDGMAKTQDAAAALRQQLQKRVPDHWRAGEAFTADPGAWRAALIALARNLPR